MGTSGHITLLFQDNEENFHQRVCLLCVLLYADTYVSFVSYVWIDEYE
jgi:hypothetical protein